MNDIDRLRGAMHDRLGDLEAPPASDRLLDRAIRRNRRARRARTVTVCIVSVIVAAGIILPLRMLVPLAGGGATPAAGSEVVNGEILYEKYVDDGWSLFAIDPDTGIERRITHGTSGDIDQGPDWSPDGTKIVYRSYDHSANVDGIMTANADGSDPTLLTENGMYPKWSPDGGQIVFRRSDLDKFVPTGEGGTSASASYLYVMDADGTQVRQLTGGEHLDEYPVWSPDGTKIAFEREGEGVFVVAASGSGDPRKIGDVPRLSGAPDWSPDGSSLAIAIHGEEGGAPGGIQILPADGSGPPVAVPGSQAAVGSSVTWSPDGQWIAFHGRGYPGTITIARPDGSDSRVLNVDVSTENSIHDLAWGVRPVPAQSPVTAGSRADLLILLGELESVHDEEASVLSQVDGGSPTPEQQARLDMLKERTVFLSEHAWALWRTLPRGSAAAEDAGLGLIRASGEAEVDCAPLDESTVGLFASPWDPSGAHEGFCLSDLRDPTLLGTFELAARIDNVVDVSRGDGMFETLLDAADLLESSPPSSDGLEHLDLVARLGLEVVDLDRCPDDTVGFHEVADGGRGYCFSEELASHAAEQHALYGLVTGQPNLSRLEEAIGSLVVARYLATDPEEKAAVARDLDALDAAWEVMFALDVGEGISTPPDGWVPDVPR